MGELMMHICLKRSKLGVCPEDVSPPITNQTCMACNTLHLKQRSSDNGWFQGSPLHGLISPIYTCQEAFHQQSAHSTPVLFLFCKPREYKVLHLILIVNQKYKHKYNDASQARIALRGHLRFRSGRDRANVPVLPFDKQIDIHTNRQANTQTNRQIHKQTDKQTNTKHTGKQTWQQKEVLSPTNWIVNYDSIVYMLQLTWNVS